VEYAQFLHDASQLTIGLDDWRSHQIGAGGKANMCVVNLPQKKPDVAVPVIELFLK